MSKKIHVRPGKGQSKAGFVVGLLFCLIGVCVAIPMFGLFGIIWTAVAVYITYVNYRNGFTDKKIDSHVIEIDDDGRDVTVTTHTGFGGECSTTFGEIESKSESSAAERLTQLQDLYVRALITEEEYEMKKKEILDEL